MADLQGVLSALADPTRRRVVELLSAGPRRAGELADELDVTPPAMSKHLRVLRTRGLVEDERGEDARVRLFRLRKEPLDELAGWLGGVEAFWDDQLEAFREHANARAAQPRTKHRGRRR